MTHPAEVFVDERLPAGAEDAFVEALSALGMRVRTRALPVQRDAGLTFLVLAVLPLQAFLTALGTRAADDTYQRLKDAIRRLTDRENAPQVPARPLILQDPATGLQIAVDPDLPQGALDQLRTLNLETFRHGPLHYDRHQKRWRSTTDEAAASTDTE